MKTQRGAGVGVFKPFVLSRARIWTSALRYLLGKAVTILVTIFVGVLITLLISNHPAPKGIGPAHSAFEVALESQIELALRVATANGVIKRLPDGSFDLDQLNQLERTLREESGLELPFVPRYLFWTVKALTFQWGSLSVTGSQAAWYAGGSKDGQEQDVVLAALPNTLLLVGTAFFLVFVIGLPLSLYLARNYGSWLDRLVAVFSPVSSIPSWVFAVLLIALFAVKLRWFPVGGKFDFIKSTNPLENLFDLFHHMALPVSAIFLGIFFQIVYTWRTFFVLYSEEDYVDLAKAKGIPARILDRRYILRPALPYVMTSFATILLGFWQLTVALEAIFQWPGIGWLYIRDALPNFWGETVYEGQLMLVIEIVVIFAYLLGGVVFFLDIAYVIVDPRIHLIPSHASGKVKSNWRRIHWFTRSKVRVKEKVRQAGGSFGWKEWLHSIQNVRTRSRRFLQEFRKYPSAILGLIMISILLMGSIYALVALPYEQYGRDYGTTRVSGRNYVPRLAAPAWMDLFHPVPRLSRMILNESSPQAQVSKHTLDSGWIEKTTTFTFDYSYQELPSDVFLYYDSKYHEKFPYVSMTWVTPDGRTINLKSFATSAETIYDFDVGVPVSRLLSQNPAWKKWFVSDAQFPTPAYNLLFAKPGAAQPVPQPGTYQLEIKSLLFEPDGDFQAELVMLGQVYGAAGTDYWRRDLLIPLLWGMPFALLVGLFGTLITLLVAILLPAIGVWFGGMLDMLIQRLTEINIILPGLTIAVLVYALFGINIWIVLGMVVVINAFGSPVKTFRSALLQAREASYIDAARSYGANDFRIITRYLVPRILPVAIPQLVTQVPGFIFLEATLGFFNIRSTYPSWGSIIYDGLARGAIYGSPFWVLAPISLLLLTSLAFALLGFALERILNPRIIDQVPALEEKESKRPSALKRFAPAILIALIFVNFIPFKNGKTPLKLLFGAFQPAALVPAKNANAPASVVLPSNTVSPPTETPVPATETSLPPSRTSTSTTEPTLTLTLTSTSIPVDLSPTTYTLQAGEFPYCIARRFNVDPLELLALNNLSMNQAFYSGMILQIPQNGLPFPENRTLQIHPAAYQVSRADETIYQIACLFGDVHPLDIAEVNNLPVDSFLFPGQVIQVP